MTSYHITYTEERSSSCTVQVTDQFESLVDAQYAWDMLRRESCSQSWPRITLKSPRPTSTTIKEKTDMQIIQRLFGRKSSAAIVHQAIDFLTEPTRAAAFCRARATDAALIASSLTWRSIQAGVATTGCMGVTIHRVYGGYGDPSAPFWGVVEIGHRKFNLETEEQIIAYLIARQDVRDRSANEVPALLRSTSED